jgi:hypothetical protein
MKSMDEENQKLVNNLKTARENAWNIFLKSKGDIEIPPYALEIIKLAFEYGYGEGVSFITAYMSSIMIQERLESMIGNNPNATKSKSFGVVPPIPKENLN